jgi:hypothetical protein
MHQPMSPAAPVVIPPGMPLQFIYAIMTEQARAGGCTGGGGANQSGLIVGGHTAHAPLAWLSVLFLPPAACANSPPWRPALTCPPAESHAHAPLPPQGLNYMPVIRQHGPLEGIVTRCGGRGALGPGALGRGPPAAACCHPLRPCLPQAPARAPQPPPPPSLPGPPCRAPPPPPPPPRAPPRVPGLPARSPDIVAVQNSRLDRFHVKEAMARAAEDISAGRYLARCGG